MNGMPRPGGFIRLLLLCLLPFPLHAWRVQFSLQSVQEQQLFRSPATAQDQSAQEFLHAPDSNVSLVQTIASTQSGGTIAEGLDNVATIFSIAAIGYFVYMIILRNPKLDEEYAKRDEQMGKLLGNYNKYVNDLEENLKHMMDMQIEWTERTLNDQRKDFVRFLNYVKDQKDFFGRSSPELVKNFRGFVNRWLTVYRECSKHPVEKPKLVVSEEELGRCRSVREIAEFVGTRLAAQKTHFLMIGESNGKGWSNPFSTKQRRRKGPPAALEEDQMPDQEDGISWINVCGLNSHFFMIEEPDEDGWPFTLGAGCCGVTFLTPMHLSLVLSFLFGLVLLAIEVMCMRFTCILLCSGELALLVVLARFEKIDDLARLEMEYTALTGENDEIAEHHNEVSEFYEKLGDFADIWCHRTAPCLRLLKEVALKLEDDCQGDPDLTIQLCETTEKGMQMVDRCAGPLPFWIDLDCDEGLKSLQKGIEACADFVEKNEVKAIVAHRDAIFSVVRMVRVRVEGCNHLPRYSMINKIDPYVRVRVEGTKPWVRTRTIENKQSPKWGAAGDKDFNFKLNSVKATSALVKSKLEVEVMHDRPDLIQDDAPVCKTAIDISKVDPGSWQRIKQPLTEKDGAEVEVSVFICVTLEHLNKLTSVKKDAKNKTIENGDAASVNTSSLKSGSLRSNNSEGSSSAASKTSSTKSGGSGRPSAASSARSPRP